MGDGKLEAFEYGRLRRLWHAVVFDVGLESVEGVEFRFGRCCRPFKGAQQICSLRIHVQWHELVVSKDRSKKPDVFRRVVHQGTKDVLAAGASLAEPCWWMVWLNRTLL